MGSATNLQNNKDKQYLEKIKTMIEREISLCLFCKYSLMNDLMKDPNNKRLIENLDMVEKKIYSYNTILIQRTYHNIYNCLGIKDEKKRMETFKRIIYGPQYLQTKYFEEKYFQIQNDMKEGINIIEEGEKVEKEEYDMESDENEGILIENVKELLSNPNLELDEEYSNEEYEYIPDDYSSHLSLNNESKIFFMFEEGKTPEDVEKTGICDITDAKRYWEEYLYLTNDDNRGIIMEKALHSLLEWIDDKSEVPSQEKIDDEN